ncbi:MAG: alcohol dehydrogenase catalytic domain-containing protein [Candidatus Latescibacteria bacterium]|nr:alcohol dehydrogenase catalytic domain-containing protein [Candidatus Latescibacterota bacterium]
MMRVARLYDYGDVRIENEPIPEIGPADALVKLAVCGICTSDTLPWYVRRKAPIVLGHEPAGTIVEVGSEASGFSPGDRVFVHHHAPCMRCRLCRRGHFSMCPTWKASALDPGGLAEFVRVPGLNLTTDTLKLPASLTLEDGAFVEPTACAVQALKRRARMKRGDRVLIIGMGIMGQILALVARHYGASTVIAADMVPYRLAKARELGADRSVDVTRETLSDSVAVATGGDLADVVVVGPGTIAAMASGFPAVGVGGTVLLFTPAEPGRTLAVDPYDLYSRDITLTTSYSCGPPDTREALEIVSLGVVNAKKLVTHRFPLEDAASGFQTVAEAGESVKTLVVIDEKQA